MEITILTKQGEQKLTILMENPIDGNYYLYSKEQNAIYLVGKEDAKLMLRSEKDFTSHTVLPIVSIESLEKVKGISCTHKSADGKVTINGKEKEVHLFAEDWKTFCLNIGSGKMQLSKIQ